MQSPGGVSGSNSMWEDELERAKQWLRAKERRRQREQGVVLAKVRAHMEFLELQRSMQREEEEDAFEHTNGDDDDDEEKGTDLALDFLHDVNPEDLRSLMEAEAATNAVDSETVESIETAPAQSVAMSMAVPLQMPDHLLARNSPPKRYASPAKSALQPSMLSAPSMRLPSAKQSKHAVTVSGSVSLGEDPSVAELMHDLQLDISDVDHHLPPASLSDHEEHKAEESAPPHLRKEQSLTMQQPADPVDSPPAKESSVDARKKKRHRNVVSAGSDESDAAEEPVENARSTQRAGVAVDPDAVAEEMRSWVTGYRDPEVLRRKESMAQRNRKPTKRFGVNSMEEQRYIDQTAKFYAKGSDSESSLSTGSDFSPADELDEQDDPLSDVELLSDDDLNTGDSLSSATTKPHRRLRNQHRDSKSPRKTVARRKSQKRKTPTGVSASRTNARQHSRSGVSEDGGETASEGVAHATNVNGSSSVNQLIDLRSSDDDHSGSERASAGTSAGRNTSALRDPKDRSSNASNVSRLAGELAYVQSKAAPLMTEKKKDKDSTTLQLAVPKKPIQSVLASSTATSLSQNKEQAAASDGEHGDSTRQPLDVVNTDANKSVGDGSDTAEVENEGGADRRGEQSAKTDLDNQLLDQDRARSGNIAENDGDVSDTGTLDFEEDDLEDDLDEDEIDGNEPGALGVSQPEEANATSNDVDARSTSSPNAHETTASSQMPEPNTEKPSKNSVSLLAPTDKQVESQEEGEIGEGEVSEAETVNFDEVPSVAEDFEFGGSREADLGFSDDSDDDTSHESAGVAAPHDDEYEQFFDDAETRKRKAKHKQVLTPAEPDQAAPTKVSEKIPDVEFVKSVPSSSSSKQDIRNETEKPSLRAAVRKESTGSNGLRKNPKPAAIAMSTVMKGRYQHSRRSIVVMDESENTISDAMRHDLSNTIRQKGNSKSSGTKKRYSEPLVYRKEVQAAQIASEVTSSSLPDRRQRAEAFTRRVSNPGKQDTREKTGSAPEARYLSYENRGKSKDAKSRSYGSDDEPLSASVSASKSRYGSRGVGAAPKESPTSTSERPSWSFSAMVKSSDENIDGNASGKSQHYPRERQMDIYDALHIEGREATGLTARDLRDGEYKRPSAHHRLKEDRERKGISFVTKEIFLETAPIPKKKKTTPAQPSSAQTDERANGYDKRSSTTKGKPSHSDVKGKSSNHYGPSSEIASNSKTYPERKNERFKPSKHSDNYRSKAYSSRTAEKDRGRRRDHSRSKSPREKDRYNRTRSTSPPRKRYRSHSRSRSYEREERSRAHKDDRGSSRNDKRDHDSKNSSRKEYPACPTDTRSEKKQRAGSLDRDHGRNSSRKREWDGFDKWDSKKKPKTSGGENGRTTSRLSVDSHARDKAAGRDPTPTVAPDTFFDYESDMYISDSDGDQESGCNDRNVVDIRFDLASVKVDVRHLKRKVYVSGINAMMDEELLEGLFGPFGIEVQQL